MLVVPAVAALVVGCAAASPPRPLPGIPISLLRSARPIGVGPRFQPPASGPVTGPCRRALGPRRGVHVEVFAANRVVIVPAAIGTHPPLTTTEGRITRARCYGDLVTLEPTGVILIRPGRLLTVSDLFRSWGEPLGRSRLASFHATAGTHVAVFVNGAPWRAGPGSVPLRPHAEIVLEIGPYVPPHRWFTFPPGT